MPAQNYENLAQTDDEEAIPSWADAFAAEAKLSAKLVSKPMRKAKKAEKEKKKRRKAKQGRIMPYVAVAVGACMVTVAAYSSLRELIIPGVTGNHAESIHLAEAQWAAAASEALDAQPPPPPSLRPVALSPSPPPPPPPPSQASPSPPSPASPLLSLPPPTPATPPALPPPPPSSPLPAPPHPPPLPHSPLTFAHHAGKNCWLHGGAEVDLEHKPGSPSATLTTLDACQASCMRMYPRCAGVVWGASKSACYRRGEVNVAECAESSSFDLFLLPALPAPPSSPPEPPWVDTHATEDPVAVLNERFRTLPYAHGLWKSNQHLADAAVLVHVFDGWENGYHIKKYAYTARPSDSNSHGTTAAPPSATGVAARQFTRSG